MATTKKASVRKIPNTIIDKLNDFGLTIKLTNVKYNEPKQILSATVVVKLNTPISTITLLNKNVSTKVPVGKEAIFFQQTIKGDGYVIDLIGKVKLNTIKTGTLTATAKGKFNVYGIPITVSESAKQDFKI